MNYIVYIGTILIALGLISSPLVFAQNDTTLQGLNGTDSDGLSVESVEMAEGNNTSLVNNTVSNGTDSDGLSVESVEMAEGNNTSLVNNTVSNGTDSDGLSVESVEISQK